jgi:hypothetical protein
VVGEVEGGGVDISAERTGSMATEQPRFVSALRGCEYIHAEPAIMVQSARVLQAIADQAHALCFSAGVAVLPASAVTSL